MVGFRFQSDACRVVQHFYVVRDPTPCAAKAIGIRRRRAETEMER
jgi:hypothetical protein